MTVLAAVIADHPDELRADLQQHYGIDLDHAAAGRHSAEHIAALVVQLPAGCRLRAAADPDAVWGLSEVLLAVIANRLSNLIYGMSDHRKRGRKPEPIGPSWLVEKSRRKLPSRALPIAELIEELNKPRRANG